MKNAVVKQTFLWTVFLGVLGSVIAYSIYVIPSATSAMSEEEALRRYSFCMKEVSKQCGIDFVHQPPLLDFQLTPIMPLVASMGAAVSVVDFDRDGFADLYVINSKVSSKNALYRNKGDGTFEDVADKLGIADLNQPGDGACMGAVWGDYDNDGFEDVLVYRWGKQELYHNDQGKGFTRVTDSARLPMKLNAGTAIWFDFDSDGYLDCFLGGYWADDVNLFNLNKNTKIMPNSFHYATNGGSKFLLRNRGKDEAGKWLGFEDVTQKMGLAKDKGWMLAAAATDLRGTGYPDLVIAVDYGYNEYFLNQDGKGFLPRHKESGIGEKSKSGMNVSFGDIYNDGRLSIYVSNITEPGQIMQQNNLWVPVRKTKPNEPRYDNLADSVGVARGGWSWGAQFGDLNNDGRIDLYLTNGNISGSRDRSYWYDYSFLAGANANIISDAKNWPPMKGANLSGNQQHCLWLNRGGKFDDICQAVGVNDTHDGRAVVLVDLWNRGVLDIVQAAQNGPLLVYKNKTVPENAWIQFELEGTKSNKSAIGAQIRLYFNDVAVQIQEVSGGNGFSSQNQRRLHFGLGKSPRIDHAEIRWPSGKTQTIPSPESGKLHRVKEPQ